MKSPRKHKDNLHNKKVNDLLSMTLISINQKGRDIDFDYIIFNA